MALRNTVEAGYEPIPGYVLRHRLGAGGYGEVWLADAPGGLQKAVKLIYGTLDQTHASSELRSLQRIKQVHHPFLLSLERIEIVHNQVIIVTELAESSLLDRYEQCRHQGAAGIERSVLLEYLRDTADALDFLAHKHSLQHLDIKPGNLLLIAERVKVADFGLIKDLHEDNQSLVGGLTPVYSAPEIFDGRPDFRSDQYSLAIVYIEMLTGQLPFHGKSTAELAKQHLTDAPDLEALPPADRPVVARALLKNPLDRYTTCRQFIDQLLKTRGTGLPLAAVTAAGQSSVTANPTTSLSHQSSSTSAVPRRRIHEALSVDEALEQWQPSACCFIGLGGIGGQATLRLRRHLEAQGEAVRPRARWLVIDTCPDSLQACLDGEPEVRLTSDQLCHIPLFRPAEYRTSNSELYSAISRRWLYNIPRSLKTEGVRPLAVLSLLHHYREVRNQLARELRELVTQHAENGESDPLRIYLLASLHGGTGSGLLVEMGFMVRRILRELGFHNYRLCALATAATTTNSAAANLPAAAGMATLSELMHAMDDTKEIPTLHCFDISTVAGERPFDWVSLIDGGLHGSPDGAAEAAAALARVASLDSSSPVGALFSEVRLSRSHEAANWLCTSVAQPLQTGSSPTPMTLSRWCCEHVLGRAAEYMSGVGREPNEQRPNTTARLTVAPPAATVDLLADQMFGCLDPSLSPAMHPAISNAWKHRIGHDASAAERQFAEDLQLWQTTVANLVKSRQCSWKEIEQVQLKTIERLIDFQECRLNDVLAGLSISTSETLSREAIEETAVQYIKKLIEACFVSMQSFHQFGLQHRERLENWCNSIAAEQQGVSTAWSGEITTLSPELQTLCQKVQSVLDSTVHRVTESLAVAAMNSPESAASEKLNLAALLQLSYTLVGRLASATDIPAAELDADLKSGTLAAQRLPLNQLDSLSPALAMGAGEVYRAVVAPGSEKQSLAMLLQRRQWDRTTTLLTASGHMEAHVFCEAVDIPVALLISSLWRPGSKTLQLAERLRTRIDIDWEPAEKLLQVYHQSQEAPTESTPVAMELDTAGDQTQPITSGVC